MITLSFSRPRGCRDRCAVVAGVAVLGACGSSSSKASTGAPTVEHRRRSTAASDSTTTHQPSGSMARRTRRQALRAVHRGRRRRHSCSARPRRPTSGAPIAARQGAVRLHRTRTAATNTPVLAVPDPALHPAARCSTPATWSYKNYTNLSGIGDAAFIAPDTSAPADTIQVKKGDDVYTFDLNASNFGGATPTCRRTRSSRSSEASSADRPHRLWLAAVRIG